VHNGRRGQAASSSLGSYRPAKIFSAVRFLELWSSHSFLVGILAPTKKTLLPVLAAMLAWCEAHFTPCFEE
jgi:hypothetical protein